MSPFEVDGFGMLRGDADDFEKYYVESGAGIWDMFWPVALVSDSQNKSLLDVGCGYGFTVDLWRSVMSREAAGCDTEEYVARGAVALNVPVYRAALESCRELAGRQFDIVYACEVIEHVHDPDAFVNTLAHSVAPGGVLALTTPNALFVQPWQEPSTVFSALSPGLHGFLFAPDQLERLIRRQGFRHVEVRVLGARLIAWASNETLVIAHDPSTVRESYLAYLRKRHGQADCASRVRNALRYRLFRESVFTDAWDEAGLHRDAVAIWAKPPAALADEPASWAQSLEGIGTICPMRNRWMPMPVPFPIRASS